MTDEVTIEGRKCDLPSGASVWGGIHLGRDAVIWKFTSAAGATTELCLSMDAMAAVISIYQGLAGCDVNFASVAIERKPSSASASQEPK